MFKSFNHGFIFQGLKQLFLLQVSFAWSCWDLNVFSLGWPVTELCVGVIRTISSLTPGPHQHLVISSHHLHENCGRSPNGFHPESPWKLLDAWRTSQSLKVVEATLAQLIPRDKMPLTVWVGDLWAKSFLFLKFPFLGPLFFFEISLLRRVHCFAVDELPGILPSQPGDICCLRKEDSSWELVDWEIWEL